MTPATESEILRCLTARHDVGMRHEDGRLYSATCHTCGKDFQAGTQ